MNTNHLTVMNAPVPGLALALLLSWAAFSQAQEPPPGVEPAEVVEPAPAEGEGQDPGPPPEAFLPAPMPVEPELDPVRPQAEGTRSARPVTTRGSGRAAVLTPAVASPLAARLSATSGDGTEEGIRLNFKDAPLSQVLNYLSEAAGFVIVQEREVSGTISITSHQPISRDDAVDLLNSVLVERGYAAVRTGRILKIVSRSAARTMDLPVRAGADPESIPRRDELVTQIIPVRYADASKLIENIRPLLSEDVTLSANESSNAIVITDTLTNIRRIAEILRALDTSIASISLIRVFPLEYAGAREVADVIREVFAPTQSAGRTGAQGLQRMMEERFRMGGGRGGADAATGSSEARQAASRVVAVADEFTNSLVVSAPDELMPTIEQIVQQLDSNISDITEVRVFRLEHSDATELASLVNQLYYDSNSTGQTQARGGPGAFNRGRTGGNDQRSQRSLLQSRVIAVGDPRTNTLIVSAARETMMTVAEMVGRLDASSDKRQQVFVVPLEHADVDNVADVLRGMFETGTTTGRSTARTTTGTGTGTSRLTQRVTEGATSANTTFNTSRGAGGGGR